MKGEFEQQSQIILLQVITVKFVSQQTPMRKSFQSFFSPQKHDAVSCICMRVASGCFLLSFDRPEISSYDVLPQMDLISIILLPCFPVGL